MRDIIIGGIGSVSLTTILFQAMPEDVPGLLWWIVMGLLSVISGLILYVKNRQTKIEEGKNDLVDAKDQIIALKDEHIEKYIAVLTSMREFMTEQNAINGQIISHQETVIAFIASQKEFNKLVEERFSLERILRRDDAN